MGTSLRLGAAYGAILAALYVLKPARNALFLSRIGAADLPIVMGVVAVVGGAAALLLASAAGSFRVERLMRWLLPALSACLIGWWYLLSDAAEFWQVASFYVWVNLFGQVTTALLWLLAGAAVDARQARRVFAFVGALGIAGAVCGGTLTRFTAARFGTVNLLPLCALALLAAAFSLSGVSSADAPRSHARARRGDRMSDVRSSPLLRVLLLMTLLGAVATSVIDFQFNAIVDAALPGEDAKAAFFGSFFAYLNAGAFVFQIAFTSRVMSRFGLGPSLLVLPTALGFGGVALALVPGIAAATLLKASDASLRHSLYRSAVELLFIPLPGRVKRWFRVFLDAAVDNVGTGIGALGVLAVTASVGVSHRHLAVLSLCLIALWAAVAMNARVAHVEAFRNALETRQIVPGELALDAADGSVVKTLQRALDTTNERQLAYVLALIQSVPSAALRPRLIELASHESPDVRAGALAALDRKLAVELEFDARRWLLDPDGRVRRQAAVLLARSGRQGEAVLLRTLLEDPDARVRTAALGAAVDLGLAELIDLSQARALLSPDGADGEWGRRELARALGSLPPSEARERLLSELSEDSTPEVAREAIQSAGRLREPGMAPKLIERLGERTARAPAIEALARYGPGIVPLLERELAAVGPLAVRVAVTRVLARIDDRAAVEALLAKLAGSSGGLRHALLSSLNKQKARNAGLSFHSTIVAAELDYEIGQGHALRRALSALGEPTSPAGRLLGRALAEKRKESLEHTFRLLGLLYVPKDLEAAFIAVTSNHARARAQALEFLDNYLTGEERRNVLELLEAPARRHVTPALGGDAPLSESLREALSQLMQGRDAWLRACSIYFAAGNSQHMQSVREALEDEDVVVRETAAFVLSREEIAC